MVKTARKIHTGNSQRSDGRPVPRYIRKKVYRESTMKNAINMSIRSTRALPRNMPVDMSIVSETSGLCPRPSERIQRSMTARMPTAGNRLNSPAAQRGHEPKTIRTNISSQK